MDESSLSLFTVQSRSRNYFPSDVLKWMKFNAKPLMAVKLMQVCKYFQHLRFPYAILENIHTNMEGNWNYAQVGSTCNHITGSLDIFPQNNLWIKGYLAVVQRNDVNTLLRKMVVCQLTYLSLENQCLTINEFEVLASSNMLKEVVIARTTIIDMNNQPMALESILQLLQHVTNIVFVHTIPPIISLEDAKNIALPNLHIFQLRSMNEAFNFDTFLMFMKAHPTIQYGIDYDFSINVSPEYRNHLQQYVNMIIKENSVKHPPPIIGFPGQKNKHDLNLLRSRYCKRKGIRYLST